MIDETHDPNASSWVEGADRHVDFPVQNLPLGRFSTAGTAARVGIAIGDFVLDLSAAAPLLAGDDAVRSALGAATGSEGLKALFASAPSFRRALRRAVFALLTDGSAHQAAAKCLVPADQCALHMPFAVRDYTDFYAGIHHARKVGSLLRPENPLLPNYKHVPVGYHGRASSIRVSPDEVIRPQGQLRPAGADMPVLGPSRRLDYELELGFWIGGESSPGRPIPIGEAPERLAGVCLLNDWSARDVQAWEYVPRGPVLAKNFAPT
ncbi:MAG: fumarylacetoacetate hydrolase family protein, partial [Novosphingobium sp.]